MTKLDMNLHDSIRLLHSELQQEFIPNKRMKLGKARRRRVVGFREEADIIERPFVAEEKTLWYDYAELKNIHKEIFTSLAMNSSNNDSLIDYEFTTRGLEEIRKRKPHKRQIRRKEYIRDVLALQKEEEQQSPEAIREFAIQLSKSACARAQHYADLDMEEARVVYKETFASRPRKGQDMIGNESTTSCRALLRTRSLPTRINQDSAARTA